MNLKKVVARWLYPQPSRPIVPDYVVERVGHGAALLDTHKPGWALLVLPGHIDLTSESACVLGQIYGTFARGIRAMRPHMPSSLPTGLPQTMQHGFCVSGLEELPLFKAEWGRVIEERLRAHFAATGR